MKISNNVQTARSYVTRRPNAAKAALRRAEREAKLLERYKLKASQNRSPAAYYMPKFKDDVHKLAECTCTATPKHTKLVDKCTAICELEGDQQLLQLLLLAQSNAYMGLACTADFNANGYKLIKAIR
jgi:hypothetical protein